MVIPFVKDLSPHGFIAIHGNSDLLAQASSNSWPGSGSISDPIKISNYTIISPKFGLYNVMINGIKMVNTDLYVIFENINIEDASAGFGLSTNHNVLQLQQFRLQFRLVQVRV